MRKFIAAFIAIVQMAILSPRSYASFDGCPNQWSIPKNLVEATPEQIKTFWSPDFNTVITPSRDSQFSFDGNNWITVKGFWTNIPKPEQAIERNYDIDLLMSYFGSQWEDVTLIKFGDLSWLKQKKIFLKTTINATKQGCGAPVSFYYLKEYVPPGVVTLNFIDEISKFKENFRNFQIYDAALAKYDACLNKWKNYANSSEIRKPLDTCYIGDIGIIGYPIATRLVPNEPGCLEFLNGNANLASTVGIKAGSNCSYSIIGFKGENYLGWKDYPSNSKVPTYYDSTTDKIVIFGTLQISTKQSSSTITCVKGKLIKKMTGINPKCPAGYTKK